MIKSNDMGKDNIFSLVIKLAVPAMIAQTVNVLYSIVDRMYIGNIPVIGDLALAGVGICGPIVTLLISFGTLIGIGGSILMAMKMGEGKTEQAKKILSNSFSMLCCISVVLTISFLLLKDKLLIWFGASPATFGYADTYLTIYTAGTIFSTLATGLNYFITCQGFSTLSMMTVISGAVSNIILDSVFIFGFKWGIAGAAWATVIAQIISCIFVLSVLFGKRVKIKITFSRLSFSIVKKILSIGLSPFIILSTDSVIIIVMNAMLQKYGGATQGDLLISCATIIQSYMMLITGPLLGITSGTQAIISYNYGAKKVDRVKKAEKTILILSLVFTTCAFLISRFLPHYFVRIFTDSEATLNMSIWGIKVFTMAIIPLAFQYTFVDGLTAMGKTKTALILSVSRKSEYVVATILLPMFFTAQSAFYAEPIADAISACVTSLVFFMTFESHLKQRVENEYL